MVSVLSIKSNIYSKFRNFLSQKFQAYQDVCKDQHCSVLFLICVNDMSMSVTSDLFLYANDTCLVFQSKNNKDMKSN